MDEKTKALLESSEERRRERVRALLQDKAVHAAVQRDQNPARNGEEDEKRQVA
jgi:hypothetical protein